MNASAPPVNWKKTGWIAGACAAVAGLVAFLANLATIADWAGYGRESEATPTPGSSISADPIGTDSPRETDGPDPTDDGPDPTEGPDAHEVYIEACEADGWSESECETSWELDPGDEWTGYLYTGYDAYVWACQDDGYSETECDTSYWNDPEGVWTGTLYRSERDVYLQECQDYGGYTYEECDGSWYRDPGNVWTGTLY